MACIKKIALAEPLVDLVEKQAIATSVSTFFDLDLYTAKVEDLCFSHKYEIKMNRYDTIHALVCWFDAYFSKLQNPVKLSTSPFTKTTHWRQTVFYLDSPIYAKAGEIIHGSIAVRKSETHFRDLDIKISYHCEGDIKANFKQMYKLT